MAKARVVHPRRRRLRRRSVTRGVARLLVALLLVGDLPAGLSAGTTGTIRYVNKTDPTCGGLSPCAATIQAAIAAAQPGDTVRVQAGTYAEALVIKGKQRLVLEADPTAAEGAVVLGSASPKCSKGDAIRIQASQDVTVHGFAITHAGGQAVELLGGAQKNQHVVLERNRIFGNGTAKCQGGVRIGTGNTGTVVLNNLIYGNGQDGIKVFGKGGPHYLVQNVLHDNRRNGVSLTKGQQVVLINNLITHNGTDAKPKKQRFGLRRPAPKKKGKPELVTLLGNLICGNGGGELFGSLLDAADAGNLTPAGTEGTGVAASPGCATVSTVYADVNGPDGQADTADDDFTLATGSPAIDAGVDPTTHGVPVATGDLQQDFFRDGIRPADGNHDTVPAYDMGAIEGPGAVCRSGAVGSCYDGPSGTAGVGLCHAGTHTCQPDGTFTACAGQVQPATEICNQADDDCNHVVDDGDVCTNHAPSITSTPGTAGAIAQPYAYAVTATDPDFGDVVTITLATAPAGMTIDGAGHVAWTPTADQVGDNTVIIRAQDHGGLFARQAFTVTVPSVDSPIARGDQYRVQQGVMLTVPAAGILANDTDPASRPLTATKLTDPDKGTLSTFDTDGGFTFIAPATVPPPPPLTVAVKAVGPAKFNYSLLAADFDGDGKADIVTLGNFIEASVLKSDGTILFQVPAALPVPGDTCIIDFAGTAAVADVDDDGTPELIVSINCLGDTGGPFGVLGASQRVAAIAYDAAAPNHYALKWLSPALDVVQESFQTWRVRYTVARLAPDQPPSILYGNESGARGGVACQTVSGNPDPFCRIVTVLNGVDGTLTRRLYDAPTQTSSVWGYLSGDIQMAPIVTDLDGDGAPEIVFQGTVWRTDGTVATTLEGATSREGYDDSVVVDLDGDGTAEIVALQPFQASSYDASVLRAFGHDGSLRWSLLVPGQPNAGYATRLFVADVDRDNRPDILFQLGYAMWVVDADGHLKWTHDFRTDDPNYLPVSRNSQVGVYDLNGDGVVDVIVHVGGGTLLFLRGDDGTTQMQFSYNDAPFANTFTQEVLVVDVDGDGHAEIVTSFDGPFGGNVVVLDGGANPWRAAPGWFNQYGAVGTNVDAAGHVPATPPHWWNTPDGVQRNPAGNVFGEQPPAPYPTTPQTRTQAQFTYAASNGAVPSAPAMVTIDIDPPNRPPVFTNAPPAAISWQLLVTTPFTFPLAAVDPDVGDTVTFSLISSTCPGATVDGTGLLTQVFAISPTACAYTVQAQDDHGAATQKTFSIDIIDTSAAGSTVTVPSVIGQTTVTAGTILAAQNLQVGTLTTVVDPAPAGQVLTQQPAAGSTTFAHATVDLAVSSGPLPDPRDADQDGDGYSRNQGDCDDTNPAINPGAPDPVGDGIDQNCDGIDGVLAITSIVVTPATPLLLTGDTLPFTATGLLADGSSHGVTAYAIWSSSDPSVATVSPTGVAHAATAGATTITATRNGFTGSATLTVQPFAPGDATPPTAAITAPAANARVTGPVSIVGTATDANFLKYVLDYAPAGDAAFTTLAESTTSVAAGVLGIFDPTMLLNGQYTLRLTVLDRGGNTATAQSVVQVEGNQKVGIFTLTFQDLLVPLAGLSISIDRTYDSRDTGVGDFGVGWHLGVQKLRLHESRVLGTGWVRQLSGPTVALIPTDAHTVTLTLPNGKVERFDMVVSPTAGLGSLDFTTVTAFAPGPGTIGSLEALANGSVDIFSEADGDVLVDDTTLATYDPPRFRYTTSANEQLVVDAHGGIISITDRNGNALTIGSAGITHSTGRGVAFDRDALGRIVRITDPTGHAQGYAYDGDGDLVTHTDPTGAVTHFTYSPGHHLRDVIAPNGVRATRNEYDDSGRLIAVTGPDGVRVVIDHDLVNHQETVHDADGTQQVVGYDDRGNPTATTDAGGHTTHRIFDAQDRLLQETDALGHTIAYTYDAFNRELSRTDALGHTTSYTYGAGGQLTSITDRLGHVTTYTLDAKGNRTAQTDAAGHTTQFAYDAAGNLAGTTDAAGHATQFQYDTAGNRTKTIDALGRETTVTFDANGRSLTTSARVTTPGGVRTLVVGGQYDAAGRLTTFTDPDGRVVHATYDPTGNVTTQTNALGQQTNYVYDAFGRRTAVTPPGLPAMTTDYDAMGRPTRAPDGTGLDLRARYDVTGNLTALVFADTTPGNPDDNPAEHVEYDAARRPTAFVNPAGGRLALTYDAGGRVTNRTPPSGHQTTATYDIAGNVTTETDALGHVTTYDYDVLGQLVEITLPDNATIQRTYDELGDLLTQTDPDGHVTQYEWDAVGRLVGIVDPAGAHTQYQYDELDRMVLQRDANGNQTTYEYDARGLLTAIVRPLGQRETRTYDDGGRLITITDFNGNATQYTYDAAGRPAEKRFADDSTVAVTYSGVNRIATMTDVRGVTSFDYDARGRLADRTEPDGRVVSYTYDDANHVTSVTSPAGTTSYTYDAAGDILTVTDPDAGVTSYTYDADGKLTLTTYPNGVTETRSYDSRDFLTALTTTTAGSATVQGFVATYDAAGNRQGVTEAPVRAVAYSYDAADRLLGETITPAAGPARTIAYTYDAVGNRLTRDDSLLGLSTYTYDANDRLLQNTSNGIPTVYGYDANGSQVSRITSPADSLTYDWDLANRLAGVSGTLAGVAHATSYAYDGLGHRVGATVDGDEIRYHLDTNRDQAQLLEEYTALGTTLASYVLGNGRVSRAAPGRTYYHPDLIGSTRAMTNGAGATVSTATYDAFGRILAQTGTPQPFLFDGEQQDAVTDLTHLRARQMDRDTGRFLSTDPFLGTLDEPASLHRYAFAANDPVVLTDPSGLESLAEQLTVSLIESGLIASLSQIIFAKSAAGKQITWDGDSLIVSIGTGQINAAFGWNGGIGLTCLTTTANDSGRYSQSYNLLLVGSVQSTNPFAALFPPSSNPNPLATRTLSKRQVFKDPSAAFQKVTGITGAKQILASGFDVQKGTSTLNSPKAFGGMNGLDTSVLSGGYLQLGGSVTSGLFGFGLALRDRDGHNSIGGSFTSEGYASGTSRPDIGFTLAPNASIQLTSGLSIPTPFGFENEVDGRKAGAPPSRLFCPN